MGRRLGLRKNAVFGERHHRWKGGRTRDTKGYVKVMCSGHLRADRDGYVREHILLAEKALGKSLPPGVQVHHVDENKGNNDPGNLVICQDASYHTLLHLRARSYIATGSSNMKRCASCKEWKTYSAFGRSGNWYRCECSECRKSEYKIKKQRSNTVQQRKKGTGMAFKIITAE